MIYVDGGNIAAGTVASTSLSSGVNASLAAAATSLQPVATTPGTYSKVTINSSGQVTGGIATTYNITTNRTVVVTNTATGFLLSATYGTRVYYTVKVGTGVALLTGSSEGYVALEISSSNSTNPASWMEVGRTGQGQSATLTVGLTLNQTQTAQVCGEIPAGYYARLRSNVVSDTPTFSFLTGEEVQ